MMAPQSSAGVGGIGGNIAGGTTRQRQHQHQPQHLRRNSESSLPVPPRTGIPDTVYEPCYVGECFGECCLGGRGCGVGSAVEHLWLDPGCYPHISSAAPKPSDSMRAAAAAASTAAAALQLTGGGGGGGAQRKQQTRQRRRASMGSVPALSWVDNDLSPLSAAELAAAAAEHEALISEFTPLAELPPTPGDAGSARPKPKKRGSLRRLTGLGGSPPAKMELTDAEEAQISLATAGGGEAETLRPKVGKRNSLRRLAGLGGTSQKMDPTNFEEAEMPLAGDSEMPRPNVRKRNSLRRLTGLGISSAPKLERARSSEDVELAILAAATAGDVEDPTTPWPKPKRRGSLTRLGSSLKKAGSTRSLFGAKDLESVATSSGKLPSGSVSDEAAATSGGRPRARRRASLGGRLGGLGSSAPPRVELPMPELKRAASSEEGNSVTVGAEGQDTPTMARNEPQQFAPRGPSPTDRDTSERFPSIAAPPSNADFRLTPVKPLAAALPAPPRRQRMQRRASMGSDHLAHMVSAGPTPAPSEEGRKPRTGLSNRSDSFVTFDRLSSCPDLGHSASSLDSSGYALDLLLASSAESYVPSTGKRVSFSFLQMRTYENILGDNPACSEGPPVSLGWRYDPDLTLTLSVDEYERSMQKAVLSAWGGTGGGQRTREEALRTSKSLRRLLLLDAGYDHHEIDRAAKSVRRAQRERRQSSDGVLAVGPLGSLAARCARNLKRSGVQRTIDRERRAVIEQVSGTGGGGGGGNSSDEDGGRADVGAAYPARRRLSASHAEWSSSERRPRAMRRRHSLAGSNFPPRCGAADSEAGAAITELRRARNEGEDRVDGAVVADAVRRSSDAALPASPSPDSKGGVVPPLRRRVPRQPPPRAGAGSKAKLHGTEGWDAPSSDEWDGKVAPDSGGGAAIPPYAPAIARWSGAPGNTAAAAKGGAGHGVGEVRCVMSQ